jgi:hypothetical protein
MPKLPGSFRIAATLAGAAEVPTILSGKAATLRRIPSGRKDLTAQLLVGVWMNSRRTHTGGPGRYQWAWWRFDRYTGTGSSDRLREIVHQPVIRQKNLG